MKLHRTKNLFTPIIELQGEYYLVDFVPKWWEMFFGLWRCALFCAPAKRISEQELSKYVRGSTTANRKKTSSAIGIGASAFGVSLARVLSKIDLVVSPSQYLIILVVLHILCLSLFNVYLKKCGYNRLRNADYKIKYKVFFKPFEKFLWYLVMTTLIYWIQIIHIPTLLSWVYESGYSFSSIFVGVGSVLFWWCGIIYFTIPDYGELIAYNSKHSLNRDMMNENQH